MKSLLPLLLLSAHLSSAADSAPVTLRSGETRVALVELYTSEGCSSCPQADEWLSRIGQAPGLWRDFVPVVFHVDYWDHLGWHDPFASTEAARRQRTYASAWRARSVYTPGFVLNGNEWRDWRDEASALKPSAIKPGVLEMSSDDSRRWRVRFSPVKNEAARFEAHIAWLGSGLVSDVTSGENRGRKLTHDFTVLAMGQEMLVTKDGVHEVEIVLASQPRPAGARIAVAAWITTDASPIPLQAVGGWLPGAVQSKSPLAR